MLNSVDSNVFLKSKSVTMKPVVSAEWNQNLFNPPYFTVAGDGTKQIINYTSGATVTNATGSNIKTNFETKQFSLSGGSAEVTYTATVTTGSSFKIVTYVKSNTRLPVLINIRAKGTLSQFGASSEEVSLFGWTKIETYIGSPNKSDTMTSFTYTISAKAFDEDDASGIIYFTVPEVYKTTHFDYENNSLWPSDKLFTYFRPGESYVSTGNALYSFPSNYRKINRITATYPQPSYSMPMSSIFQNPYHIDITTPFPNIKNTAPSDLDRYKYFVSDDSEKIITAIYESNILTNKLVIKFNSIATIPTINIAINGTNIVIGGSANLSPDANGLLVLYWTGNAWSTSKWSNALMPKFTNNGSLSIFTQVNKISIVQVGITKKAPFSSYPNGTDASNDLNRMQIIEISPRLEIDLSDYVTDLSISKSLDSKNNAVPISSIEADDASLTLSGIPLLNNNQPVPIFSSQSNSSNTILAKMLRKNIKFYVNFYLDEYSHPTTNAYVNADTLIPGGVFYADSWSETDVDTVSVQMFDVSRYLQSTPAPDYVSNLRTAFEVITNILEMVGFSDYDYDSLYDICNDKLMPLDLTYFYCNSTDSTIIDVLSEIFIAYQIAAYIDEYGVMRFLSLADILQPNLSPIVIDDEVLADSGFNVQNKQKIGTISIRFQAPKIRQSLSVQNITDPTILESASFIYTTANTVVWAQESSDSVGFNFLNQSMSESDSSFKMDVGDLLDPFHTFSLNSNGYAAIEDEIVSFAYKEYKISLLSDPNVYEVVSVKNDLELASEINRFIKTKRSRLISIPAAQITNAIGNGTNIVFYANHSFSIGQNVMISGVRPSSFNVSGTISNITSTTFTVAGTTEDIFDSVKTGDNGIATIKNGYDVKITPTGNITNVKRGMFGSKVSEHTVIQIQNGSIDQKGLSELTLNNSTYVITPSSKCSITNYQISALASAGTKTLVYPTSVRDTVIKSPTEFDTYKTYSMKGMFNDTNASSTSAIGLFFNLNPQNVINTTFVEFIRYAEGENVKYIIAIYYRDVLEEKILAWADVTGYVNSIISNFEKTFVKSGTNQKPVYTTAQDETFHLKVAHWLEPVKDVTEKSGEDEGEELISVFINNVEILNWQVAREIPDPVDGDWKEIDRNPITKLPKKVALTEGVFTETIFGAYTTADPVNISGISYPAGGSSIAYIKEIYATEKPLKDRSVNYYFQDSEFLNGLVQGRNVCTQSKSYSMQVRPQISGINYYDVQYTTPAATAVDVLPIQYLWQYFPGSGVAEQQYRQKKIIDEYSLAYSSILNTGFRARMAIANNSNHMVFLKHDADQLNQFTNALTLWTHEIIAPSDPEIIEKVIDASNASEVAQLDSSWIQSRDSAEKLSYMISKAIEGFSTDVSIQIFGNPLIQVGDEVLLSYSLAGISQKRYIVHSVSHSYDGGLSTSLVLNEISV